MKQKLAGLVRLTRFKEYLFFVSVTTLLGVAAGNGTWGLRLVAVLLANILAVGFSFMINDVEDADDDALNPKKATRNPVSARHITPRTGWIASWIVFGMAFLLYLGLGWKVFAVGFICLLLGVFYSWRKVRFKNIAFVDFISHMMMLSGLQFLSGFLAFDYQAAGFARWFFPFLFVVCISLYGELFNEIRDLEGDLKAGLRHTVAVLGKKVSTVIMITVVGIGAAAAVITIFVVRLLPGWVCWTTVILAVVFIIPPLIKAIRHKDGVVLQESLQKPLEIAAAFALLLMFALPWASQFFQC